MINITSDQWELYLNKYKNLMWRISHMISGDSMLASLEDNFSDLCIAAIESINGFHKKTGKSVDEMFDLKLFDQYTKTCLWTAKARKGVKLSERIPFRNKHLSIDELRSNDDHDSNRFDIPDASATLRFNRVDSNDAYNKYDVKIKKMLDLLKNHPEFITTRGEIKVDPVAKAMNMTVNSVKKIVKELKNKNDINK